MTESDEDEIKFRKRALETASRPVSLDEAFQVISPYNWLTLLIVLLIIASFVIWLFWGTLFIRVSGKGILMSVSADIISIQAPTTPGTISEISVKPGQMVDKNTPLIHFNNPLLNQLNLKRVYLRQLREVQNELIEEGSKEITLIETNVAEQVGKSQLSLNVAREKLNQLRILIGLKEKALSKGIIDLPNVTATRVEYFGYEQEISAREAELIAVKEKFIELKEAWKEKERNLALLIYKEKYAFGLLKRQWEASNVVMSPVSGVISEIRVKAGDYVSPGQILISVIPANQDLYALVFIPAIKGKLLKVGMDAQVVPTFVNKLEYGSIKGKVDSFSLFPVTQQNVLSMVKSSELSAFFGTSQPMLSVRIRLEKNPQTTSGYEWTSSNGPDLQFTQGSLVDTSINVEKIRPIGFLIRNIKHIIKENGQ
ncbi:p-hydroxybenzoic acid efflux subunit AaeA [Legionella massiliensis]|uniref:p-hydroxybenzoic acid efflux subunit AaeA n=1 Tax=Legionella massiliensis TaxID=1034943 RepID=A0A078KX54_9GAMM|nr:NHLP bacteriocin system secretion protein [Legionella massiliensis]CDZ77551.1 p-hydroxybenzoic acid efflux subunit AaeA [Legionella massiliensis]CEE13289.1 p-hydroxybenzoic acid efflux pump subunit AaeA [Legionella massiliensis]